MKKITLILLILSFLSIKNSLFAQAVECDSIQNCWGNNDRALTLSQPSGKGAHYVDVDKTASMAAIRDAITIEMRINAMQQSGKRQYVAGLWGPAQDVNDVWVIYIDENDQLVFEINGPNTKLGQTDNTIASADFSSYYDSWHFISCVFDGNARTASIYIDGILVDEANNPTYPAGALRQLQNSELSIQIGSSNALSNDPNNNRTFLGQLDEIRIWNTALAQSDIMCKQYESLNRNEPGLEMYWRCNELENVYDLCDATGNGNFGRARSGARCLPSDYVHKRTIFLENLDMQLVGNRLKDTIRCDETRTYRFRAKDTSDCMKSANVRVYDEFREKYTLSTTRINNMQKDQWYEFEVTINADFTGTISNRIAVWSANRCYIWNNFWMDITRLTETDVSVNSIDLGLLKANCIEVPYIDTVITLCNTTDQTGNPKNITVSSFTSQFPDIYQLQTALPATIPPGDCLDVRIRFISGDTSGVYNEVWEILTNDACDPVKQISVTGEVKEVIGIYAGNSNSRLDSIDFGTICVDFASDPVNFSWANLLEEEDISIENIILPPDVITLPYSFPIVLEPETGYLPEFFRYFPTKKGAFQDSITFVVKSNECTIMRKVYVKGEGKAVEAEFSLPNISFGNVVVGQEGQMSVDIINSSDQSVRLSLYLKRGEAFFFTGARIVNIAPNSSITVPIIFRPAEAKYYEDELCFFDTDCYQSRCIPLDGTGVIDRFKFEPIVMETGNVIGCESVLDTIDIINNLSVSQTLSDFVLDDPSGKFSLVQPLQFPQTATLKAGEIQRFILRYTPNDVTTDRADRAFIRYKTADGEDWNAKLFGRSVTPSIFITDRTVFGTIEVGDTKQKTLVIENTSPVPIRIDSIQIPQGYTRIYPPASFDGSMLNPRDTVHLIIEFEPTDAIRYTGDVTVFSNSPCEVSYYGFVEGEGEIIPLEIPLSLVSFGFIYPCDCETRQLSLINRSEIFPMNIDSVIIDGQGIVGAAPQFFTWTSTYYEANGGNLPYQIPAFSIDTLKITYCPESPSNRDSIDHSAMVHVYASGSGWANDYSSYLTGKRALILEPLTDFVNFPPTRVDTFSVAQYAPLFVPGADINPQQKPLRIDSITFDPPERVFSVDSIGGDFPIYITSLDSLIAKLQFKPRAVREYWARMVIHIGEPCLMKDTTILCYGSGFAPAYGLSFEFENPSGDTIPIFHAVYCDTLEIPLFSSRQFPADVVDINMYVNYDTSVVELVALETKYVNQGCDPHLPFYTLYNQTEFGNEVLLKNFCKIDSLDPVFTAKFIAKSNQRDTIYVSVDSMKFDTEEVILYEIIAETPEAIVMIDLTEITILNEPDFGTVNVLDCNEQDLLIVNTGDNPTDVIDMLDLPADISISASVPDLNTPVPPGDTIRITLRYCPTKKDTIESAAIGFSSIPCTVYDTTNIYGDAYAPEYDVSADVSQNFSIPDTLTGVLGDTVTIPLYFEKDMSVEYNGTLYWMKDLSFELDFLYNKRALKFIEASNTIPGNMTTIPTNGNINLSFSDVDDLSAGLIAELKFLVVVPDSLTSYIGISTRDYESESIMFYDIIPYEQSASFRTVGRCNLTYFEYSDKTAELMQNHPNPWAESTNIDFTTDEKANVELYIYNSQGKIVLSPLDGSITLSPGEYSVEINSQDLPAGVYYYTLRAGVYQASKAMVIVK